MSVTTSTTKVLDLQGTAFVANKVNEKLKTVNEIPGSPLNGMTVIYIGTTGETYIKGHVYQYNGSSWNDISPAGGGDSWTETATVNSNNQVTFSGLSDNYGYDLFCEDKAINYSSMTKSGSGDNITLTYVVSGASEGDVCKLRIFK